MQVLGIYRLKTQKAAGRPACFISFLEVQAELTMTTKLLRHVSARMVYFSQLFFFNLERSLSHKAY